MGRSRVANWRRCGCWLLATCVLAAGGRAAEEVGAAATEGEATVTEAPAPGDEAAGEGAPTLTITGRKASVEQGERSIFSALPPRDLILRPLTESPGLLTATTVVGEEEIRWLDAHSIVDAMKYVPGAWTERRGRKVKQFFSVRGQRYPYPTYLVDGAWFREFHETDYFMSAANVERIEILRSSSALLLAPDGMTGLVNIVPRTYAERQTRVDVTYGSEDTWRTQISHGDALENLAYGLGLGCYHTDGPSGENARENMTNLFGRLVYTANPDLTLALTALYIDGDRQLQLAEPPASGTLQTRRDSFDPMRTYVAVARARYEPDDTASTELTTMYGKRRFHGHRVGSPDWLEEDYEYGARAIQSLTIAEDNVLRFGGMFNHWISPTGKRFYVGNRCDLVTYSGVIADEQEFDGLTVNAGYRWSRTRVNDFGGFNVEGTSGPLKSVLVHNEWEDPLSTVTAGASYQLTDTASLHGNFAWGQISARPGMLDENLEKPGDETRRKYDLGVRKEWDGFGEVGLTGFYVDQKDAPLATSTKVKVDDVDYALYENADRDSYGVELDVRSRRFDNGVQVFLNAVAMRSRRESDGDWERDAEVPEFVLGGGVSYLVRDVELSLLTKHVGSYENERFLPAGTPPAPLGSFTELSAMVRYFFGAQKEHTLYFGIDNLTDREYSTVVGYPNEGRTFRAGVGLTY